MVHGNFSPILELECYELSSCGQGPWVTSSTMSMCHVHQIFN